MHKIVVPLVGLLVFGLTLAGLMLFGPGGVSGAAEPFFEALARRDFVAAAAQRTQRFQQAVPQEDFERFLSDSKLGLYASGVWSGWQSVNEDGRLDGRITTATGEVLPMRVSFRKEGGEWRVDGVQPLREGAALDEAALVTPSPVQAVALIRDATALFARGVAASDFTELRDAAAPEFRETASVADLGAQFKPFVDAGIDLRTLDGVAPNLTAQPSVDENGILRLVGYYAADGLKLDFDYKFVYRYTDWRLIGLEMSVAAN